MENAVCLCVGYSSTKRTWGREGCDGAQKLSICQTSGKNEEKINYKGETQQIQASCNTWSRDSEDSEGA